MKRQDIKPRTLIASRRGSYGHADPVVVIDTESLWLLDRRDGARKFSRVEGWKCDSGRGSYYRRIIGYLTVKLNQSYFIDRDDDPVQLLLEWVSGLPERLTEDDVNLIEDELPDGLHLTIQLGRDLVGPWTEVRQAEQAQAEESRKRIESERRQRARRRRQVEAINTALEDRGIERVSTGYGDTGDRVTISIASMAALLNLDLVEIGGE